MPLPTLEVDFNPSGSSSRTTVLGSAVRAKLARGIERLASLIWGRFIKESTYRALLITKLCGWELIV